VPRGSADLGPISPELALVDPELARRARELLPEPREWSRPPPPIPAVVQLAEPATLAEPEPEPDTPTRRWPRAVLLAAAIFAAGAASGTFLRTEDARAPATVLELQAGAGATQPRPAPRPRAKRPALRPPTVTAKRRSATAAPTPHQRRRHARVTWASNVLGVEATISRRHVALVWQRPAGSARVVVLRTRRGRSSSVVYRGRATRYRDSGLRPCTGYRYTIVNYDRRGDRSTGVPTSVVTRCA
jgi:hypothetical protein